MMLSGPREARDETSGSCGPSTAKLLREIGAQVSAVSGERRETEWLLQRCSIAVARGNAASIPVTRPSEPLTASGSGRRVGSRCARSARPPESQRVRVRWEWRTGLSRVRALEIGSGGLRLPTWLPTCKLYMLLYIIYQLYKKQIALTVHTYIHTCMHIQLDDGASHSRLYNVTLGSKETAH